MAYGSQPHHKVSSSAQRLHVYCVQVAMARLAIQPISFCYTPPSILDNAYRCYIAVVCNSKMEWAMVTWISEKKWTQELKQQLK